MSRRTLCMLAATAAAAGLAGAASAGIIPALEVDLTVSDGTNTTFNPPGTALPGDLFNYSGASSNANWSLTWDLLASADPSNVDGAFVTNGFTVENLSSETLDFTIMVTLPLDFGIGFTDFAGSIGLGLTGTDATVATLSGAPIWSAMIDGSSVQDAFADPYSLGFAGDGSASDSFNFVGTNGGATSTIGITLSFSLTPGDTLITTGAFGIIPAPAGLGLLAVAGLGGLRRRRGC